MGEGEGFYLFSVELEGSRRKTFTLTSFPFLSSFPPWNPLGLGRGVQAFRMLNVPILGMVENMSFHVCKSCGHKEHTFGEGGVARTAEEFGVPLLGQARGALPGLVGRAAARGEKRGRVELSGMFERRMLPRCCLFTLLHLHCPTLHHQVPLDIAICSRSDSGAPIVVSESKSPGAEAYVHIARELLARLRSAPGQQPGAGGGGGPPTIRIE